MYDFVGTPLYMSPQLLSKECYNAKSDIWSIGIMIYELVFGFQPWPARDYFSYMFNVTKIPLKFPVDIQISNSLRTLIQSCLEKDEAKRIGWEDLFNCNIVKENYDFS